MRCCCGCSPRSPRSVLARPEAAPRAEEHPARAVPGSSGVSPVPLQLWPLVARGQGASFAGGCGDVDAAHASDAHDRAPAQPPAPLRRSGPAGRGCLRRGGAAPAPVPASPPPPGRRALLGAVAVVALIALAGVGGWKDAGQAGSHRGRSPALRAPTPPAPAPAPPPVRLLPPRHLPTRHDSPSQPSPQASPHAAPGRRRTPRARSKARCGW